MMRKLFALFALMVAAQWASPPDARADEYHYVGQPLGAAAAGMGGAFTGVATDSSAAFYNPAGLAFRRGLELSLSASVYGVSRDRIAGSETPQPPTFIAFPSTFVLIKTPFWEDDDNRTPRHRYGVSILVPAFSKVARQQNDGSASSIVKATDTTSYFGASYAYRATDDLSFGVSAFMVSRALARFEQESRVVADDFDLSRRELEGGHSGLQIYGGALYHVTEDLSVGLTIRSPTLSMFGALKLTEFSKAPGGLLEETSANDGVFLSKLPFSGTLGVGWRLHEVLMIAADVSFYASPGSYATLQTTKLAESVDKISVVNGAVGVEVKPLTNVTVRVGGYTDRSSRNRSIETSGLSGLDPHYYVITASAGYEAESAAIIFGGAIQLGELTRSDLELHHREVRWWVAGSYRL